MDNYADVQSSVTDDDTLRLATKRIQQHVHTTGELTLPNYVGNCTLLGQIISTTSRPLKLTCNSVTMIGEGAFNACAALTSVSFDCCTSIQQGAFYECAALTSVSFNSCKEIGFAVFANCNALMSVKFNACKKIESRAFLKCATLTSVEFNACKEIGQRVFADCAALMRVSFKTCTGIGTGAFDACAALTSVEFNACEKIGARAFRSCAALTSVEFNACTEIGRFAFIKCEALTSVSFNICNQIKDRAFEDCTAITTVRCRRLLFWQILHSATGPVNVLFTDDGIGLQAVDGWKGKLAKATKINADKQTSTALLTANQRLGFPITAPRGPLLPSANVLDTLPATAIDIILEAIAPVRYIYTRNRLF